MPSRPEVLPLLWRVEREVVLTDTAPAASLVSVAYVGDEWFVVACGDVPAVVGRPFDPELDVPSQRLEASLEVAGRRATHTSASSTADQKRWSALLQWDGMEPASQLRMTLELDGRSREYVLAQVD